MIAKCLSTTALEAAWAASNAPANWSLSLLSIYINTRFRKNEVYEKNRAEQCNEHLAACGEVLEGGNGVAADNNYSSMEEIVHRSRRAGREDGRLAGGGWEAATVNQ